MKNLMGRQLGKGTGVAQIPEKGTDILQALEEKRNGMGTVLPEKSCWALSLGQGPVPVHPAYFGLRRLTEGGRRNLNFQSQKANKENQPKKSQCVGC